MICLLFIYIYVRLYVNFTTHELPTQRHKNVNMLVNKMKWDKIKWTCWWRVTLLHFVCECGFLVFSIINCTFIRNLVLSFYWHVSILKRYFFFWTSFFLEGKGDNSSKYKRKRNISLPYFSYFSLISFFFNPKSRILLRYQIMGVKCGLASSRRKWKSFHIQRGTVDHSFLLWRLAVW